MTLIFPIILIRVLKPREVEQHAHVASHINGRAGIHTRAGVSRVRARKDHRVMRPTHILPDPGSSPR